MPAGRGQRSGLYEHTSPLLALALELLEPLVPARLPCEPWESCCVSQPCCVWWFTPTLPRHVLGAKELAPLTPQTQTISPQFKDHRNRSVPAEDDKAALTTCSIQTLSLQTDRSGPSVCRGRELGCYTAVPRSLSSSDSPITKKSLFVLRADTLLTLVADTFTSGPCRRGRRHDSLDIRTRGHHPVTGRVQEPA